MERVTEVLTQLGLAGQHDERRQRNHLALHGAEGVTAPDSAKERFAEYALEIRRHVPGAGHGARVPDRATAKHASRVLPTGVAGIQFAHRSPPVKGMAARSGLWRVAHGRHREPLVDTPEGGIAVCLTTGIMARAEGFVHDGVAHRD